MSRGVVYGFEKKALLAVEVRKSIASVKKFHPDWQTAVHTDIVRCHQHFDIVIPGSFEPRKNVFRAKIVAMLNSPFDETLYLDTDTQLRQPVDHVFDLFPKFDFAMSWAMGKSQGGFSGDEQLLELISEYNTGVVFWKRTPRTTDLFTQWLEYHDTETPTHRCDQFSLCHTLFYNEHIRVAPLTVNYNQRHYGTAEYFQPAVAEKRAFIIHNRDFIE